VGSRQPRPVVSMVAMHELTSLRAHGGVDRALLSLDVEADLRNAFHWNLKQLFVFVLAEYESDSKKVNQVILWDKIVEAEEAAVLKFDASLVKYALVDQSTQLRNATVTLSLVWDHMPVTGRLFMDSQPGSSFDLPSRYI